jgi:acyl-coenzyme A thioesterase PaaI-like protein
MPPPSNCFVCAPSHPSGLHLLFELSAHGAMVAEWTPGENWEGFHGMVHGGMLSTVLDEAMAKAVAVFLRHAPTAELTVRFRRPVPPGQQLAIRAWIVELHARRVRAEGAITGAEGQEFAHAWGTFLPLRSAARSKC